VNLDCVLLAFKHAPLLHVPIYVSWAFLLLNMYYQAISHLLSGSIDHYYQAARMKASTMAAKATDTTLQPTSITVVLPAKTTA